MSGLFSASRGAAIGLAILAGLGLAGCESVNSMMFGSKADAPQAQPGAPAAPRPINPANVTCPIVEVTEGGAAHRVYAGGQDSQHVRYQFSIGDVARECAAENGQLAIRIGVDGKVLLGPAGAPSSFTVPVTLTVRRDSDNSTVASRTYQVAAAVPPGSAHTTFSLVAEPIVVPLISEDANEDYSIFVGFQGQKAPPPKKTSRRRAR